MSDDSDIEIQKAQPKKTKKKMPASPSDDILKKTTEPKKLSTKDMILDALITLKTRKGVSLQAIKKYLAEKYNVDTEKINYIIKKNIKKGVESGLIVQVKGLGASGSFKLNEKNIEKKKKKPVDSEKTKKPSDKSKKSKIKSTEEKPIKTKEKKTKEKGGEKKSVKIVDASKPKVKKPKSNKKVDSKEEKKTENKKAKIMKTPAKKKMIIMKRKSIGSIIKTPKMKPKAIKAKA